MNEATDDYEACRVRLFDSPFDSGIREQMLVIGDRLEINGHPLGLRIALSEALAIETDRKKRASLAAQLEDLPNRNDGELLGPFARFRRYRRVLNLEWRGGAVYKARLDTRYLCKLENISAVDLLRVALKAPVLRTTRHLWVRTRGKSDDLALLGVIRNNADNLRDLEVVAVGPGPRPRAIGPRRERDHRSEARLLPEALPKLILVSVRTGTLSLSLPKAAIGRLPVSATAPEFALLRKPLDACDRTFIGRGLWVPLPAIRTAAAEAAVRCEAVGLFVESFMLLLCPGVCSNPQDLAVALGNSREPCPPLDKALQQIASNAARFEQVTRSAAGQALAARKA